MSDSENINAPFNLNQSTSETVAADRVIALLSLWAIANAETLIWREFAQLGYIFEFLIETHRSNP
jgi:hypothetical protein